MRKSMRFQYKLLTSFIWVGVIPLIFAGLMTYGFSKRLLSEQYSNQAYDKVAGISGKFDQLAEEYGDIMNLLSDLPEVRQALIKQDASQEKDIEQRIHLLLVGKKQKASIYILSRDGRLHFSTKEPPPMYSSQLNAGWGIFRAAHERENEVHVYPHTYETNGGSKVVLSMIRTIHASSGQLLGYVVVDFSRSQLVELVNASDTPFSMDFVVRDANDYTVIHTKYPELEGTLKRVDDPMDHAAFVRSVASAGIPLVTSGYFADILVQQSMGYIKVLFAIAAAISLIVCLWFATLLARNVTRPFNELVSAMKRVSMGDLSVTIKSHRTDEFGTVGSGFNSMVKQIQDLIAAAKDEQRRLRIAEMKALQAQLNPHFIYNTLDLIKWNAKMNHTAEINQIVVHLAKLLRGMIRADDEIISLQDELDIIENYLFIQRYRFMDRLSVEIRVNPDIRDAQIPRLILHPLVENAIVHGFENKLGIVGLSIRGYAVGEEIQFELSDNGIGMDEETLERIRGDAWQGGIGVRNVHQRIRLYYGEAYGLQIESEAGKGTHIRFRIPYRGPEGRGASHDQGAGGGG